MRLPVTPLITTYQDTAERSAGTLWYNGNGRCVVMVGVLVRILTAVVFYLFIFLPFFLTKLKQVLVLSVLGLGSRLQEVRPTIPASGVWGAKPPILVHSLA